MGYGTETQQREGRKFRLSIESQIRLMMSAYLAEAQGQVVDEISRTAITAANTLLLIHGDVVDLVNDIEGDGLASPNQRALAARVKAGLIGLGNLEIEYLTIEQRDELRGEINAELGRDMASRQESLKNEIRRYRYESRA